MLTGKKSSETTYVERLAPTAFGPETKLPKTSEILELKETQRMEKVLSDDAMFAIKWAPSVLNLDQRLPVGEVARIGRLFLRQSLNHQRT